MVLKRLFKKFSSAKANAFTPNHKPVIISRGEHGISRQDISENALKVLYRLKKHGFSAYLVGGGVRDVLLGFHPKDFDIATDAKPEQIKKVFNNCRLIGRRFRLAHIFYGRDIVEVATFRAKASIAEDEMTSDKGMILRDNVYGTLEEDAWRRDFTLNALYYNIKDFSLVDYCGGLSDLKKRILRVIGDPNTRFVEDPVRMLRAIRLACKLDLKLDKSIVPAIHEHGHLISHVPPARLYEEILKLFHSGAALKTYEQLMHFNLFYKLFPQVEHIANHELADKFIRRVLENTDQRVNAQKPVNPAFIFSAFLWYPLRAQVEEYTSLGQGVFPGTTKAASTVLSVQRKTVTLPKRHAYTVQDIWQMQLRLERRQPRQIERLVQEPRFRAAYDFLLLRGEVGEQSEIAQWWYDYVEGDEHAKTKVLKQLGKGKPKSARRKRPKKKQHE